MDSLVISTDKSREAVVRMYPVCECGQVLKDLKFELPYRTGSMMIAGDFSPNKCPNCLKAIRTLQCIDIKEKWELYKRLNFDYECI